MDVSTNLEKSIGELVDLAFELYQDWKRASVKADQAEAEYKKLLAILAVRAPDAGLTGASGLKARLATQKKEYYSIADAVSFYEYVLSSGRVELLQKRLNTATIKELEESGVAVPGVRAGTTETWVVKKL